MHSVPSPPDQPTLRELQAGLAACLQPAAPGTTDDPIAAFARHVVDDAPGAGSRVSVHRNNARNTFNYALQRTYPVACRRVGDDFFNRLAAEYRAAHPARSGDLLHVGESFPGWLARRLAGTEYAWLADLARLEWACEEVLVAAEAPALTIAALADVPADRIAGMAIELAPAIRCVDSGHPVWSVWQSNQPGCDGAAVDPSLGGQCVVVQRVDDGLTLHCVPAADFAFVRELALGNTLEAALAASGVGVETLQRVLGWLFTNGMVAGVSCPER